MSIIIPANSAVSGGFDVANSCMFNSADSAYLARAQGTATGATKYTLSMWIKRSKLSSEMNLIGVSSGNTIELIKFNANDKLYWYNRDAASNAAENYTSNVFQDTSAWYHLVFAYDSTQGAAADQRKLYINGVNQTWASAAAIQSNAVPGLNLSGATINIGAESSPSNYYGGYMSEVNFIDGLALAADSFGEFDEDSGIWKPINASGLTFGNNGFYLNFEDSANLGNDATGGTDFSENNIAATDQGTDTCTNNFATFNPLRPNSISQTYSEGNTFVIRTGTGGQMNGTQGVMSGKWYYECLIDDYWQYLGWTALSLNTSQTITCAEATSGFYGLYSNASAVYTYANGSNTSQGSYTAMASGQIWGIAFDADNAKMYFSVNGVFENSSNPANQTNPAMSSIPVTDFLVPAIGQGTGSRSSTIKMNFGNPFFSISSSNTDANGYGDFEYTVPSGYFALCTKNLAEYG